MSECSATRIELPQGIDALVLENNRVSVSVLPDKGADIYRWVDRHSGIDVMWKSPWGLRRHRDNPSTSTNTTAAWLEGYEGGWQVLFPSGGGPCEYKGIELNFHGEASVSAWDVDAFESNADYAMLRLSNRLARSPFSISREMILPAGASHFTIEETVVNEGGEPMDYMWGHHPAYGAPFIGEHARIDTNAAKVTGDDLYDVPTSPVQVGKTFDWPRAQNRDRATDLSVVPGQGEERATLAYLHDFQEETAWYGITNRDLALGAGLAWSRDDFPCAWFWQEMHASPGFPWYKGVYVMAIEPNTSFPGQGLVAVTDKSQMQCALAPGERATARMTAVLYETSAGVDGIELDGSVHRREK
jgi:galactose mutarotase-like enzyme